MTSLRESLTPDVAGAPRVFCCHSAVLSGEHPPNSLAAVEECVSAKVPRLEVDVRFMADDAMVIFHDDQIERETTGSGRLSGLTRKDLRGVRFREGNHGLCFLEDVVRAMAGSETLLQVDLKLMRAITPQRATGLRRALEPLRGRLIVGSQAHWNLRRLEGVPLAYDPSLQWRWPGSELSESYPKTAGLYGFLDDSPLAMNAQVSFADYIDFRVADLIGLEPRASEWMVDIRTILELARLGCALGDELRQRGVALAAWTLRPETPDRENVTAKLFGLGVETIIAHGPFGEVP